MRESPMNAATYPKGPWRSYSPTAIMRSCPHSWTAPCDTENAPRRSATQRGPVPVAESTPHPPRRSAPPSKPSCVGTLPQPSAEPEHRRHIPLTSYRTATDRSTGRDALYDLTVEVITRPPANYRSREEQLSPESAGRFRSCIPAKTDVCLSEVKPLSSERKPCLVNGFLRAEQQPVPMDSGICCGQQLQVPALRGR